MIKFIRDYPPFRSFEKKLWIIIPISKERIKRQSYVLAFALYFLITYSDDSIFKFNVHTGSNYNRHSLFILAPKQKHHDLHHSAYAWLRTIEEVITIVKLSVT